MKVVNGLLKLFKCSRTIGVLVQPCQKLSYWSGQKLRSVPQCITINATVKKAIETNEPVVTLESAIITHGMSVPFNYLTALEVESVIRKEGAVPATIGIIDGQIYVGMSEDQIKFLSECKSKCVKVSRRDFPCVIAKKWHGGTTVAGTMVVADKVGIPVFVTGGVGGVHMGGETSMDISADLTELGRTPLAVVSSGVKSILDVGRTLEFLETEGVCVVTVGDSKAFPDFFTRDSGLQSPYQVETCTEAANVLRQRSELNLKSGILFAVPIPVSQEADGKLIKEAIDLAVKESEHSVSGKDVTPFILRRVSEITEGKSLLSNIDLIKNNAKFGARIASEYCKLYNKSYAVPKDDDQLGPAQPVG